MKTNEKGFTLVELLATIGAGLILLAAIATAVAEIAFRTGLATEPEPDDLPGHVRQFMYNPTYDPLV